jgi:CRP/FNR family transcriptional regulator
MLPETLISASLRTTTHSVGEIVLHAGRRVTALPLVETGVLKVVLLFDAAGHHVVPVRFERGEIALTSLLFSDGINFVDVVVARSARLRWLRRDALERAVEASPALMLGLMRFLGQRLREVQRREQGWLVRGVHARVVTALASAARDAPQHAGWPIRIIATHGELAERSGISRPKVSHQLKQLERAGVLRLGRGVVEILQVAALPGWTDMADSNAR